MARAPSTAGLLKSRGGKAGAIIPKPRPPLGKPGIHDPEPQGGPVPKKPKGGKPPFVPKMGRGRLTGLATYNNQVR